MTVDRQICQLAGLTFEKCPTDEVLGQQKYDAWSGMEILQIRKASRFSR